MEASFRNRIRGVDFISKNAAPPRVQFFGWLLWLGRVKSGELLITWGIIRDHGVGLCLFCGDEMESADHVLLLCSNVWRILLALLK